MERGRRKAGFTALECSDPARFIARNTREMRDYILHSHGETTFIATY